MSLQWVEGFEARQHEDLFSDLYDESPVSIAVTTGRLQGSALDGSTITQNFLTRSLDVHATWVGGLAAQINAPSTVTDICFFGLQDGSSMQLGMYIVSSGDDYSFELYRGNKATGTLLDSFGATSGGDGYNYWEFKATIHSATGSWEIRKNGIVVSQNTGQNTQSTANAFANKVRFETDQQSSASSGVPRFDLDDIYICNGSGTSNNDFLGDQVVEILTPTADGTPTNFIAEASGVPTGGANYTQVDDAATLTPDNDATYVKATLVGDKDRYGMSDLAFSTGIVSGVMLTTHARTEATGIRVMQHVFDDGTNGEGNAGSPIQIENAVWDDQIAISELNPGTSLPYTTAQLNSGEFGYEIIT